ncbi:adaptor protein MecA [Bombilactobacillus folatiphilus]|uniref:Adaptor protein MecA n=1 Tax=Bombilactobacillus folatiphilus TaxID=2923362 RepID=A0ABY4P7Z0_9LACO|nr:adaptor protein MecA [Bombilactobacillus folatiphilus]UQS81734.1 adaptor protein MecA [Bombilactobacillus folatiphilus]
MEVEHVNKNMIRVTLESHDLKERGVTVLDLLGDRQQIETFFYNILEEVDTDHTFVKDHTVTFQVIPKSQGLELLITKVPQTSQDDDDDLLRAMDLLKDEKEPTDLNDESETMDNITPEVKTLVFSFEDFENFVSLSKVLKVDSLISDLYRYQSQYYLELKLFPQELHTLEVADVISLVKEYGQLVHLAPAMLEEYGQLLMEQTALQLTRYYFI